MATTTVTCDASVYVLASSVDCILQNKSPGILRVAFAASLPAVDTEDFMVLDKFEVVTKSSGFPAGNIYVRSADAGRHNLVAVSS